MPWLNSVIVNTRLRGNRVLHPSGSIRPASFSINNGRILDFEPEGSNVTAYDADDLLVVPGIVDIHGDAFERQIHPRPRIGVPIEIGLLETDRQMIANGITTAFHGLTVNWAPGSRDIHAARAFLQSMERVAPRLHCDTKVHLRHEALSLDTVDAACEWMRQGRIALCAINDHREMVRRDIAKGTRLDSVSLDTEAYAALAHNYFDRSAEVPASLEKLTAVARDCNIPLLSHDDDTPEIRAAYRALGCSMCEFPADLATAEAALAAGDHIILGSPNILRGGSHCGRVGAAEMIRQGLCSVLCSDYYYPSILVAPFLLAAHRIVPFSDAWNLVSRTPAEAAKLDDRGTFANGKRADLLFIDDRDPLHPEVRAAFVAGVLVHTRGVTLTQSEATARQEALV